jgi:hypothetical protein
LKVGAVHIPIFKHVIDDIAGRKQIPHLMRGGRQTKKLPRITPALATLRGRDPFSGDHDNP